MQSTTFPFEVIVHDDASTDSTADIIREYAIKYPHIIKPIFQSENQYSKGFKSRMMADINAAMSPYSKYIAICEGDDFWIKPYKIQKQVEFMEAHPDYSMCFTGANVTHPTEPNPKLYQDLEERPYSGDEIIRNWIVPTASVLYRREIHYLIPVSRRFVYGDNVWFLTCATHGNVYCLGEKMVTYRAGVGVMSQLHKSQAMHRFKRIRHYCELYRCFPKFRKGIKSALFSCFYDYLHDDLVSKRKKRVIFKYMMTHHPRPFARMIWIDIKKRLS